MCACTEAVRTGIGAVCAACGRPKWPITMLNHTNKQTSLVQNNVWFLFLAPYSRTTRYEEFFCLKARNGLIILASAGFHVLFTIVFQVLEIVLRYFVCCCCSNSLSQYVYVSLYMTLVTLLLFLLTFCLPVLRASSFSYSMHVRCWCTHGRFCHIQ